MVNHDFHFLATFASNSSNFNTNEWKVQMSDIIIYSRKLIFCDIEVIWNMFDMKRIRMYGAFNARNYRSISTILATQSDYWKIFFVHWSRFWKNSFDVTKVWKPFIFTKISITSNGLILRASFDGIWKQVQNLFLFVICGRKHCSAHTLEDLWMRIGMLDDSTPRSRCTNGTRKRFRFYSPITGTENAQSMLMDASWGSWFKFVKNTFVWQSHTFTSCLENRNDTL